MVDMPSNQTKPKPKKRKKYFRGFILTKPIVLEQDVTRGQFLIKKQTHTHTHTHIYIYTHTNLFLSQFTHIY